MHRSSKRPIADEAAALLHAAFRDDLALLQFPHAPTNESSVAMTARPMATRTLERGGEKKAVRERDVELERLAQSYVG